MQTKIRVADEVLTSLAAAALENEHIDKAMAAMGIAQNLKRRRMSLWHVEMDQSPYKWGLHKRRVRAPSGRIKDEGGVIWVADQPGT